MTEAEATFQAQQLYGTAGAAWADGEFHVGTRDGAGWQCALGSGDSWESAIDCALRESFGSMLQLTPDELYTLRCLMAGKLVPPRLRKAVDRASARLDARLLLHNKLFRTAVKF